MKIINFEKKQMKLLQIIDSARFMASSLSNLVNNHSEGIHKIKCEYRYYNKKMWNLQN